MIKLNLGCSNNIKNDYINIDLYSKDPRVKIADVQNLDFIETNSVTEILAHDVLEHIPFLSASNTIKEWSRVLTLGGIISIQTTNIEEHIKAYNSGKWNLQILNHMLFAGTGWTDGVSRYHDWHKSIYTIDYIAAELNKNNIEIIKQSFDPYETATNGNLNLYILGKKYD